MESELKAGSTRIVKKYGYEYHLVMVERYANTHVPQPCFMGYPNYALSKCVKIKKGKVK